MSAVEDLSGAGAQPVPTVFWAIGRRFADIDARGERLVIYVVECTEQSPAAVDLGLGHPSSCLICDVAPV
jgi:hypothetical protein